MDSRQRTQLQKVYNYLMNNVATASMVEKALGVHQKCITWYKRELEKSGRLFEVYKAKCEVTGFQASYLSCNPENNPNKNQLRLDL